MSILLLAATIAVGKCISAKCKRRNLGPTGHFIDIYFH